MRVLKNLLFGIDRGVAQQSRTPKIDLKSRRNFLKAGVAASLLLPSSLSAQEEKSKLKNGYDLMPRENGAKFLKYTNMIQGLWQKNRELEQKLHPEINIDATPQQQAIFAQQKPCEFTEGYVYHGRSNLSEILLNDELPKHSHITRVPQTWALQPFVDLEEDPAIFVIDAFDFNRAVNKKNADFRMDTSVENISSAFTGKIKYNSEIYPSFTKPFSLDKIQQIIINEDTEKKYKELVHNSESARSSLSDQEKKLAEKIKSLFKEDKFRVIKLSTKNKMIKMSPEDRFLNLSKYLRIHMVLYGLNEQMPKFQLKTTTSTKAHDKSPDLLTVDQAASRTLNGLKTVDKHFEEQKKDTLAAILKEEKRLLANEEKRAQERKSRFWRNTALISGGGGLLAGASHYVLKEFGRALELQRQEDKQGQKPIKTGTSGTRKKRRRRKP